MLLKQVMLETGLTKKAIEYYIKRGLLNPRILDNSYRDFSQDDLVILQDISFYRQLGLTISDIQNIFIDIKNLESIVNQKEIELKISQQKINILKEVCLDKNIRDKQNDIHKIVLQMPIAERLMTLFPGYIGKMICVQFMYYLQEPIQTKRQKEAFDTIVDFLDHCPHLDISEELQQFLDEQTSLITNELLVNVIREKESNVINYQDFLQNYHSIIEDYIEYKKSNEYQNSLVCQLNNILRQFCKINGYYDIFIPAMRQLSPAYNHYYEKLLEANEQFIKDYPHYC